MMWEALQPTLNAPLDTTKLGDLNTMIQGASAAGIRLSLDLHNYARYTDSNNIPQTLTRVGSPLNASHLEDFWVRLSTWVRADPTRNSTVFAYDLMNEPHDLTGETGAYVVGTNIYDFETQAQVTTPTWGDTPVWDTSAAYTGSHSLGVTPGSGGGNVLDGTAHSYASGSNLRCYCYIPAGATGTLTARIVIQASATGSGYSNYTQYSNNQNTTLTPGQWTLVEWANCPAFLLANIGQMGVYFGGAGFTGSVKANIDDLSVGAVTGAYNPNQVWEYISQRAVSGLRYGLVGATSGPIVDTHTIMVSGNNYSSLVNWIGAHPQPWITDPVVGGTIYESHHYWDSQSGYQRSGTYSLNNANLPYSTELANAQSQGYTATPTVTTLSPTSASVGATVTVTGTNFTNVSGVTVGGVAATTYSVASATSLTVTVPTGVATGQSVQVAVTTQSGTTPAGAASTLAVVAPSPTITGFSPNPAPVGNTVTVTGAALTGATAVTVNGTAGTGIVVASGGASLTFIVGAGSTSGPIVVTTPAGTATSSTSLTIGALVAGVRPFYWSGLPGGTIPTAANFTSEKSAGVKAHVVTARWANYYTSLYASGVYTPVKNTSYINGIKTEIANAQAAGLDVMINWHTGAAHPDLFANESNARFVDQNGLAYTQGQNGADSGDAGDANLVFNSTLRTRAQAFLSDLMSDLVTPYGITCIRAANGHFGEWGYPPFHIGASGNSTVNYWGFDALAQADRQSYATANSKTIAGTWRPGNASPNGEARTFIQWYYQRQVDYGNWSIQACRNVGFSGPVMLLMPGFGVRHGSAANLLAGSNPDVDAAVTANLNGTSTFEPSGEISTGHWFQGMIAQMTDTKAIPECTWIDCGYPAVTLGGVSYPNNGLGITLTYSGADPSQGYWGPYRRIAYYASLKTPQLRTFGEMTSTNHLGALDWAVKEMLAGKGVGLAYFQEADLFNGSASTVQLAGYGSYITANPDSAYSGPSSAAARIVSAAATPTVPVAGGVVTLALTVQAFSAIAATVTWTIQDAGGATVTTVTAPLSLAAGATGTASGTWTVPVGAAGGAAYAIYAAVTDSGGASLI